MKEMTGPSPALPDPEPLVGGALGAAFKNPGVVWRGKPFWSWNGKLDKSELLRQIHVMKEMGFGGYFMHSRTGLITEYLGDEWFDLINTCADEGERLGLEAWLYDEDRWPSGLAGGLVTQHPEHRMKFLRLEVIHSSVFSWANDVVAAFLTDGIDGVNINSFDPLSKGADAPTGKTVLVFRVAEMQKSSFYNGYTYVDTLSRKATDLFIQTTHEKYAQKCGPRMGRSIKGIFTDEPHRGTLMSTFGNHAENGEWAVPYTPELFSTYQKYWGEDLLPLLPRLFLVVGGVPHHRVKWRFVETLQRMFLENFAKPCHQWCRDHGVALTGHILHENTLSNQVAMSGSMMRYYPHMDAPGIDILGEGTDCYWVAKQLQSAARQTGKGWLMSELYGCTGWQMGFDGHKAVGDWQALFGINLRCHHLSWYTMEGEAKRDYPASILHQSAWHKDYEQVEAYFARLGLVLSHGTAVCETLVINPVESLWTRFYPGWCKGLAANDEVVKGLEEIYANTFRWLQEGQIDFDYGDEGLMAEMARVEKDKSGRALLKVGSCSYRQVVLSGVLSLRGTTLGLLKDFLRAGGRVVIAGDAPTLIEGMEDPAMARALEGAEKIASTREVLVSTCQKNLPNPIRLFTDNGGLSTLPLFSQLRQDEKGYLWVVMNMDRKLGTPKISLRMKGIAQVTQWDCRTGREKAPVAYDELGGFVFQLPAMGELVLRLDEKKSAGVKPTPASRYQKPVPLAGPFDFSLAEPNVLVLDFARWKSGGDWQGPDEILKVDRQVRDDFGLAHRAGNMVQPWFAMKTPEKVSGPVSLQFEFQVEKLPKGGVFLAMENPGYWQTQVNGVELNSVEDAGWWVDIAFRKRAIPPGALRVGANRVTLSGDFSARVNLEALYILGDFSVLETGAPCTVSDLPPRLPLGSLRGLGMPFYGAGVTYHLNHPALFRGGRLTIPSFSGALVKLDGLACPFPPHTFDVAPGSKRHDLEVVLTRRNSFGPLHQIPMFADSYGPGSFVTTGEQFAKTYQWIPTGLLGAPLFEELDG